MIQTSSHAAPSAEAPHDRVAAGLSNQTLRQAAAHWRDVQVTCERIIDLGDQRQLGVTVGIDEAGERMRLLWLCNVSGRPMLHWGVGVRSPEQWRHPPRAAWPANSERFDDRALRSAFEPDERAPGLWRLEMSLGQIDQRLPRAINCVVYDAANDRWLKHGGRDIQVRIRPPRREGEATLGPMLERIVEAETGTGSWTLMHRFNLCYDLLDEAAGDDAGDTGDVDALALLFAWLRYSALRQLDWQRNYNTQPRELAHAQHRLTCRLADLFQPRTEAGLWTRWMLASVGRGGEGQQVRDQILHIMHRHHIKERRGTWIEQWHQKLHNNTTPDDIVICQAYIAFLEHDGDEHAYWRALEAGGVTRQRLEGFERPITERPDHFPDKKDGLLHDFHQFLRLLKSVHAGTDLETSIDAARRVLDPAFADWLVRLNQQHVDSTDALLHLTESLTDARRQVLDRVAAQRDAAARRDLLYVDLGLEARLRTVAERFDLSHAALPALATMTQRALANLALIEPEREYAAAVHDWQAVQLDEHPDRETLLRALAATERTSRAVRDATDRFHARLQPVAETLGRACGVDPWTVPIFSEEVIRGTLAFVLARVVRQLEPTLRRRAGVGGWQIISGGETVGRIELAQALREVQDRRFDAPTVVLADAVAGDEEIPANVCAVLTRQTPDLVSHVAVRARNERVLLACCLDETVYEQLQGQRGQRVRVVATGGGDVRIEPTDDEAANQPATSPRTLTLRRPRLSMQVLGPETFTEEHVGGKSRNLANLREQLPEWVHVPPSAALSFGCFEHTLASPENEATREAYARLLVRVDDEPAATLPELRQCVQTLALPQRLCAAVEATCREQGIALPEDRESLWRAIRAVWASKWTDRAYRARRRLGIAHDELVMAVLLQQVVPADYAFVIHTADPTTSDANTLYAEVVVGLGETLVGNAPGLALAFRMNKQAGVLEWVSLPSKSAALRGHGVIARSDTNGEDLAGYAGAGLYDSVMAEPARVELVDYADEPLVRDASFRERLCRSIAELGMVLERAAGAAQDVEGAVCGDRVYALQTRPQVGL